MAKYDITHLCGHDERIALVGPTARRESRIEWEESRVCRDCYHAQQTAAAAEAAAERALPALVGSDKQVAWAITLREKFLAKFETWRESEGKRMLDPAKLGEFSAFADQMTRISDARFWIDNRDRSIADVMAAAYKLVHPIAPSAVVSEQRGDL